jgi:hypothetical protein
MLHNPTSSAFEPRPRGGGLFTPRAAAIPLRPRYIRIQAGPPPRRWPLGIGLLIAGAFSLAVWAGLFFAARALFGG